MSIASAPPGGSAVASAIAQWWPGLDPTTLDGIAQLHLSWATQLDAAADTSDTQYQPLFNELLKGHSGDTLQTSLNKNANSWRYDAAEHNSAAAAVSDAADYLRGLQLDLTDIINADEPAYETAISQHDYPKANQILAEAKSQADAAATFAATRISSALNAKFGTPPASTNNGGAHAVLTGYQQGGDRGQGVTSAGGTQQASAGNLSTGAHHSPRTAGSGAHPGVGGANPTSARANSNGISPSATSTTGPGQPGAADSGYGQPDRGQAQTQPVTQSSPVVTPVPTAVSSGTSPSASSTPVGGGASPSASSSTLGSGSGQNSASPSTTPGEGSAPVSAGPSSGAATASAEGGPGPGVASGMEVSGALPSAVRPPQQLSAGQVLPAAGALAPAPAMADAAIGGPASNLSSPPPMGAVSGSDGGGGAVSGGTAGGGAMPMLSAPGPLAPYGPPGAGSLSSTQPASIPAAPLGSAPGGPGGGGVAGLIAGGRAGDRSAGAPTKRVNPDLVLAQRVLAGLVKACPTRPIFWAVSVLRTPVGPQTLIAGSAGGGGYLPPEVSVPSTVRLAVLDPALPSGWAAAWMGWQSPLAILVDHYERVTKVVADVVVSAMTTSELWSRRPDCGGEFSAVRHEELVMSVVAPLVGGHRLTATDAALASRLTALDRGGDISKFVAAQLTRAVWTAAAQPDDTGLPIAVKEDADMLALVAEGTAQREDWDSYRREVERRANGAVMMPETHAPRDADDSPGSVQARMWYRHYYARARIAEMVSCWAGQPVSILDVAYCGVAAGFGAVIAAVVTELEKRIAEFPGAARGTR